MDKNTYYRVVAAAGRDMGLVLGKHRSFSAASAQAHKDQARKRGGYESVTVMGDDAILCECADLIPAEGLTIGEKYPELIEELERRNQTARCARYLAEHYRAVATCSPLDARTLAQYVEWADCASLEQMEELYGDAARKLIEEQDRAAQGRAEKAARVEAIGEKLERERSEYTYTFPAVRGIQAGREFYTAQIPFGALVKLFTFDDEDTVPAQLRAQRALNDTRAKKIGSYITENADSYVLPSITACCDQLMAFEPTPVVGSSDRLGLLHIPMEATLLINDGQHRRKGIEYAIKENPALKQETVSVTLFFDRGLEASQQIFCDINQNMVRPSTAISRTYDKRNGYLQWIPATMPDAYKARIDFENNSTGAKSMKLWSVVAYQKFVERLLGINEKEWKAASHPTRLEWADSVQSFFSTLELYLPQWETMINSPAMIPELRAETVLPHAVFLEALGVLGRELFEQNGDYSALDRLQHVRADKVDPVWQGRCIVHGKLHKTRDGIMGTAALLLSQCGLKLSPSLRQLDQEIRKAAEGYKPEPKAEQATGEEKLAALKASMALSGIDVADLMAGDDNEEDAA